MTMFKFVGAAFALALSTGAVAAVADCCTMACCKQGADCCDKHDCCDKGGKTRHTMPATR